MIGSPEISTDGLHYYRPAIRDAFGKRATHGVINKTYSVSCQWLSPRLREIAVFLWAIGREVTPA